MYSVLKDFAGPAATVIAAAAASFVVFYFNRAQVRMAEQRLVLDVFDRRWAIVEELRISVSEIIREGDVPHGAYKQYAGATLRSAFLFGPEVTDYLESVRREMTKLIELQDAHRLEDEAVRARAADSEAEAFTAITQFYETYDTLIRPYMAMQQKLP
jgi:hypothetical protein